MSIHRSSPEPPPGTVLAFRVCSAGTPLDYVTFLAPDGRWYTTGNTGQAVPWEVVREIIVQQGAQVSVVTAWEPA